MGVGRAGFGGMFGFCFCSVVLQSILISTKDLVRLGGNHSRKSQ